MCFSPSVSFGAGIVLSAVGVASIGRSRTVPQRALSVIPMLFAIQQFSEGVVWLSLLQPAWAHWHMTATYAFLIFAQMVWPVYVPLSMYLFEQDKKRKTIILITLFAGILLATYIGVALFLYPPVAVIGMHHIQYKLSFALANQWYYGVLYFIPTILSSVISSNKSLRWLGYLFLASYIFTRLLFHLYVISVWCFFGAVISIYVLAVIVNLNRKNNQSLSGTATNMN